MMDFVWAGVLLAVCAPVLVVALQYLSRSDGWGNNLPGGMSNYSDGKKLSTHERHHYLRCKRDGCKLRERLDGAKPGSVFK
tara:strand:+ start:2063 stop:2305 length:243 start_codon:yes stop_codon:yes gene_type:complete